MKTIEYFRRTYGVPGDNFLTLPIPKGTTPRNAVIARAAYKIYRDARAVVFTGLDQTMPTTAAPGRIIRLIAEQEHLPTDQYSFFDLQTAVQDDDLCCGEYSLYVIFLKHGQADTTPECVVRVLCPDQVALDFNTSPAVITLSRQLTRMMPMNTMTTMATSTSNIRTTTRREPCPSTAAGVFFTSVQRLTTVMVQLVASAAIAPTATSGSANAAPTTPTVTGNWMISLPWSLAIIIVRALPAAMISLTFRIRSSPVTLNSSRCG